MLLVEIAWNTTKARVVLGGGIVTTRIVDAEASATAGAKDELWAWESGMVEKKAGILVWKVLEIVLVFIE